MATIARGGVTTHTNGDLPPVGSTAPDFKLTNSELSDIGLDAFPGTKKILYIVPSLDTPTCSRTTLRFNEAASRLKNTLILIASADLPFAQQRFCTDKDANNIVPLSMMRNRNFAKDYGVLIQDGPLAGITARALLVLDEDNKILYSELVDDIRNEPDIDNALKLVD
jgi:thiol peroxidase